MGEFSPIKDSNLITTKESAKQRNHQRTNAFVSMHHYKVYELCLNENQSSLYYFGVYVIGSL